MWSYFKQKCYRKAVSYDRWVDSPGFQGSQTNNFSQWKFLFIK